MQAGLASLLNAHKLFDANFYSSGVHIQKECLDDSCAQMAIKLDQTLTVVFDPKRTSRTVGNKKFT
jgi:phosphatidylinositol glycan class T